MGVDGFRFDLATVLARYSGGFSTDHPLVKAITNDEKLRDVKLIAEPWDPGPGGYQLGNFASPWAEWNDQYRDTVRRFWRGDPGMSGDFARRLHGSADYFDSNGRRPYSSVNFVSCHDGFTLSDVVSFEHRNNFANGEENRDGHSHNFSANYGCEGLSDNSDIRAVRRQQRFNMLASLLFSQGTPMILAGDEFGNSQDGNNNAYAQDNPIGWLDWSGLKSDPDFTERFRQLVRYRQKLKLLRLDSYVHSNDESEGSDFPIQWFSQNGDTMSDGDWAQGNSFGVIIEEVEDGNESGISIILNASNDSKCFSIPTTQRSTCWRVEFCSGETDVSCNVDKVEVPAKSITLLVSDA
jgi:glycogen operon protein